MKSSSIIFASALAAGLLAGLPAHASGNAHKYPVVPKEVVSAPAEVPATKPAAVSSPQVNDAMNAKPAQASTASTAPAAAPAATAPVAAAPAAPAGPTLAQRLTSNFVIVSRYEPLSGRDSLEAVPDLNRGHGKGK